MVNFLAEQAARRELENRAERAKESKDFYLYPKIIENLQKEYAQIPTLADYKDIRLDYIMLRKNNVSGRNNRNTWLVCQFIS